MNQPFRQAIDRGLGFLEIRQLPSGEFPTLVGSDPELADSYFDSSPFVTAQVLYGLRLSTPSRVRNMVANGLRFLEREMHLGGVLRYYARGQWKHCRIPPDLDDTACASHVLSLYRKQPPRNRWIFKNNRNEEGLFFTWIVPRPRNGPLSPFRLALKLGHWSARRGLPSKPAEFADLPRFQLATDQVPEDDVDPVVNANAILYLGENDLTRPAIQYLIDLIQQGLPDPFSLYYRDPLILYYKIMRAHQQSSPALGVLRAQILRLALDRQQSDGSFGTDLATAMGANVLALCSPDTPSLKRANTWLLEHQQNDGSWLGHAFYSGPHEFWGSCELTTSLALEALTRLYAK